MTENRMLNVMDQLLLDNTHSQHHPDLTPEYVMILIERIIKLMSLEYSNDHGEPIKTFLENVRDLLYFRYNSYETEVEDEKLLVFHRNKIFFRPTIEQGLEWSEISDNAKEWITNFLVAKLYSIKEDLTRSSIASVLDKSRKAGDKLNARKRFILAMWQVRSLVRILRIKLIPQLISIPSAKTNPYANRKIRKKIDAIAFRIYGHWLKNNCNQAVFFANNPRVYSLHKRKSNTGLCAMKAI